MSSTTRLPPPLDGEVRFDDQARADAAEDFGHLLRREPEGVLLPGSAEDVAATVHWAAGRGRRFAAQGNRHSVYGRAQAGGGIVADLRRLRAVHGVQDDRVVVDAGATWREVLAATLPRGLVPPVLPDYLDLSVGGTVVVGGVGGRTWRSGVVADNLLELRVVTGRGEQVACSSARNARLFDAVRAGLGQVAVVTGATLPLVPAPERVRRFLLVYPGYLDRLATLERALRANGQWWFPHPWLTTFVGDAAVEAVVAGELAELIPAGLGPLGQVALSPVLRASVTSPLLRLPSDRLCRAFNLIRLPPTGDPAVGGRLVAANRAAYQRVRDAGGTLYPVSAFPMSPADWRGHFGAAFGPLAEAKDEHDPGRVLTPGYEVF